MRNDRKLIFLSLMLIGFSGMGAYAQTNDLDACIKVYTDGSAPRGVVEKISAAIGALLNSRRALSAPGAAEPSNPSSPGVQAQGEPWPTNFLIAKLLTEAKKQKISGAKNQKNPAEEMPAAGKYLSELTLLMKRAINQRAGLADRNPELARPCSDLNENPLAVLPQRQGSALQFMNTCHDGLFIIDPNKSDEDLNDFLNSMVNILTNPTNRKDFCPEGKTKTWNEMMSLIYNKLSPACIRSRQGESPPAGRGNVTR